MIYAGIDVAKDKHEALILDSDGVILAGPFSFNNDRLGFSDFLSILYSVCTDFSALSVGLEATGHYSNNLVAFLLDHDISPIILNPLHTNLYRKSLSLRKTKTDRLDAHAIVTMLRTECFDANVVADKTLDELKSLTRYRFSLVQECTKLKNSYARLCVILFPELEKLVSDLKQASVYALFSAYPSASAIASCHLTRLTKLLSLHSKGHYGREKAIQIRNAARSSIGSDSPVLSLELTQTIALIQVLEDQIASIEKMIIPLVDALHSPLLSVPGISYTFASVIIAETGNFKAFHKAEQVLAFAGLEPSVYQSGKLASSHAKMVKRGSKYLRYALFNAAKQVCIRDDTFSAYLAKKRAEGKAYNVAVSHAAKKLTRVLFHLVKTNQSFMRQS